MHPPLASPRHTWQLCAQGSALVLVKVPPESVVLMLVLVLVLVLVLFGASHGIASRPTHPSQCCTLSTFSWHFSRVEAH